MQNNNFPTFDEMPSLKWFANRLPKDGIIDAIDARFLWNYNNVPTSRIKSFSVAFLPKVTLQALGYKDHPVWKAMGVYYAQFDAKHGNCFSDWRQPEKKDPECLFDTIMQFGFETIEDAERCRSECARVREFEWARDPNFDLSSLVRPYTDEEYARYDEQVLEDEIRSKEQERKKTLFTEALNSKIKTGEMVVPDGATISGSSLMISVVAAHWSPDAPINVFQRQFNDLRKSIFEGVE